ncbi:MAG TPA: YciI family protein [Amnibacterium sp.]|nr:YciI family protein [Amnibacterium sp.]
MKVVLVARIAPDAAAGPSGLALELRDPSTATTLRRRGAELVLADGPSAAAGDPVAGVEELDVASLEVAVRVAARLAAARVGAIEVRRVDAAGERTTAPDDRGGGRRYLLLHVLPAEQASDAPTDDALLDSTGTPLAATGVVAGSPLLPAAPGTAATVRVRNGELLVEPGPAAGRTEELAGYDLLHAADLDEAIAVARAHPTLAAGSIEIRPLVPA